MEQERLAKDFQEGSWEAFERLWKEYEHLTTKLSYYPLKSDISTYRYKPTKEEVEDNLSQLKLTFLEGLTQYEEEKGKFSTFIIGTLLHKIHRYASVSIRERDKTDLDLTQFPAKTKNEEEEKQEKNEQDLFESVKESFKLLSPRQCEVMTWLYVDKLTVKEITEQFGIHKDVVGRHKSQAIKRLRVLLNEKK